MGADILIALGIGVSQLVVTWYAVHISVAKHRIRHASIIGVVGGVGIALTISGAIKSAASQQDLMGRLEKLQATNVEELALNYVPSVAVIYENNRVNVLNQGRTNIYLWGARYGAGPVVVDKEPRLVPPGILYYIFAETLEEQMRAHLRDTEAGFTPCYVFITTQDSSKHTVKCLLIGKVAAGILTIHTQTIGVVNGWLTN